MTHVFLHPVGFFGSLASLFSFSIQCYTKIINIVALASSVQIGKDDAQSIWRYYFHMKGAAEIIKAPVVEIGGLAQ